MCCDGNRELYHRLTNKMCLTETRFVHVMGLVFLGSSLFISFFLLLFLLLHLYAVWNSSPKTQVPRRLVIHISLELESLRLEFLH